MSKSPEQAPESRNPVVQGLGYAALLSGYVYFLYTYGGLLRNPAGSLLQNLPVLFVIQVGYCVLGGLNNLSPPAPTTPSSSTSQTTTRKVTFKKQTRQGKKESGGLVSQIVSALLACLLSVIMSVLVHGLLVMFGAPATSYVAETYLCALHISLLSVQPLVYVYNLHSGVWRDIISVRLPLNGVYGASVGTWLGAWLGAIPIPLDWDRPWQQWPLTILTGAYIGTIGGTIVGLIMRQVQIRKSKTD